MIQLLLALFAFSPAHAYIRTGQFSVGGSAGLAMEAPWARPAFKDAVGAGPKASLFGRYHHDSALTGFELALDYFSLSTKDIKSKSATINLFWRLLPFMRFHPIFSIGTGIAKTTNYFTATDGERPIFRLRAGLEWELNRHMDVAFHLDHYSVFKETDTDPNMHVLAPSVGIIVYFGEPISEAHPAEANASVLGSPTQASSLDTDGDGVPDSADRCLGTPKGTAVNELGCAAKQAFEVNLDLKFQTNLAKIVGNPDAALAGLAKILRENADLKVEIQGHTDNSGKAAKNLRLSQARADMVRNTLIKRYGILGRRLIAKGYGSSQPVDTNNNPEGRKNNRRVTARVVRD